MARRPISLSLRFSVYERDKYTCQYCGGKPPGAILQIDHVKPVALGGSNRIDNLRTACRDCNIGKGARDPGLPMASRLRTPGEIAASNQWWARWWAEDAIWARDLQVRALAWEIAAKGAQEPIYLRRSASDQFVPGLAAIGVLRVEACTSTFWIIRIERHRGKSWDEELRPNDWPWGLSVVGDIRRAPSIDAVH